MEKLRSNLKFHLLLNICFVLFITGASYYHTPLNGLKDTFTYLSHVFLLQSSVAGILYFLSLNRIIFKLLFPIIYITYGLLSFGMYSMDVSITPSLLSAILQSKPYIMIDFISIQSVAYILGLVSSLILILKAYNKLVIHNKILLFSVISLMLVLIFPFVESKRNNTFKTRQPYVLIYSLKEYLSKENVKLKIVNEGDYRSTKDSITAILVLGETVRADHLQINGYARKTTPLINTIPNCISYKQMYTNKTYTAASLPQILTDRSIYDKSDKEVMSLFSVLHSANVSTSWIGNQQLEYDYKSVVLTNDLVQIIDELKSITSFNKLKDEALLPYVEKQLKREKAKQLISVHMIGSHWWYENRYHERQRKFTPVIDSKYIPAMTKEQMLNSYDNTIIYLDFFLNELIQKLSNQNKPAVLVYISDHGESLGENGKWLHAHDAEELTNPAFIIWYSDEYKEKYPEKIELFKSMKEEAINTDLIYDTILAIFEIKNTKKSSSY